MKCLTEDCRELVSQALDTIHGVRTLKPWQMLLWRFFLPLPLLWCIRTAFSNLLAPLHGPASSLDSAVPLSRADVNSILFEVTASPFSLSSYFGDSLHVCVSCACEPTSVSSCPFCVSFICFAV